MKKKLAEGELLYTGAKVKVHKSDKKIESKALTRNLEDIAKSPKPNKNFLGFYWKRQEPVVYDKNITERTEAVLENRALNSGFFTVKVKSTVKEKKRKASVKYEVSIDPSTIIDNVSLAVSDSILRPYLNQFHQNSLLKIGESYNLSKIKNERKRITAELRKRGFYFFREDYLIIKADTTKSNRMVSLAIDLKPNVDSTKLFPQYINNIYVYPDLNAIGVDSLKADTLMHDGLTIISRRELMKPKRLRDAIRIRRDDLYSIQSHQNTLRRLSYLNNYKFIDIQFAPALGKPNALDVLVSLTPRKKNTIKGSLGFSIKSRLYAGPEASLTYLNRNLWGGAEQLKITSTANFNFPLAPDIASLQEQEISIALSQPAILLPFWKSKWIKNIQAKTIASVNIENQIVNIPLNGSQDFLEEQELNELLAAVQADSTFSPTATLTDIEFSWAYQWQKRVDLKHKFSVLDITLQQPEYQEPELREFFLEIINQTEDNPQTALLNLEKMLIAKPNYIFLYDSRLKKLKRHNYFYRGKVALAGNILLSNDNLLPRSLSESQFFQIENDLRYFWKPTERHSFGARLVSNLSIPFKNEVILPFFDLYNLGGPNSVRAYRPRQIGPGSTVPTDELFFFTGTGDILLESSLEWRPKIGKSLELGIFVDAGNVWLFDGGVGKDELAIFKWDNFHRQIGVGTGVGLRYNLDVFLVRLDFAIPLTKPWLPEGERWVGNAINFGSGSWRRDNLTLSLSFGYSF